MTRSLIEHYNDLALRRDEFVQKNEYFYSLIYRQYRYFIPEGKSVLEIGCGTGHLLDAVKPSRGVGIDLSPAMIEMASKKYPYLEFHAGEIGIVPLNEAFDYIILSGVLGEVEDIQEFLGTLKKFCREDTRVVIEYYSFLWQYLLKLGEKFGGKMPQPIKNWVTIGDLKNFCVLTGYDVVCNDRRILFPVHVPVFSCLVNRFIANFPLINALTLSHFLIIRPLWPGRKKDSAVSIVVPCRNEKGNIESAVKRTPVFGAKQEFIFVEGHSKDGTYEEILRVKNLYPDRDIKVMRQTGKGKGDAMRLAFSAASGDLLMILDSDLTVPPEELPKFYEVYRKNRGEFINGSRMIYPMEKKAMRFLNLIANKTFSIFFSWLLGQRFKDTLCGTKVLSRKHYEMIAANRSYFGEFDPFGDFDLIFGAAKLGLKVVEVPVHYKDRAYGSPQIRRFRDGLLLIRMCLFCMMKIKFRQ